jgi:AcrR family transcriptional regulator
MTRPVRAATEGRPPPSRDQVLRGPRRRARHRSLSMRKLGEDLGVEVMSLYNHVGSKGEMLDDMIDLVFSEIDRPGLRAGECRGHGPDGALLARPAG